MTQTLGVFAKQPLPGQVKTRLATARSPQWAAAVYEAFLLDQLDRLTSLPVRRVVVYDPPAALPYFQNVVGARFELTPQQPGGLGQRLAAFFTQEWAAGAESVIVLGTDSPTLPVAVIRQAFAELAHAEVVIGPATDGGYYLLGCARPLPALFDGVDWSTSRVLEQTITRLNDPSIRLALLPPWYDVDTPADWDCLRGHVAALRRAGLDPEIPRTEMFFESCGCD
jgi:rSAM/selenodomain-associated transferase 1